MLLRNTAKVMVTPMSKKKSTLHIYWDDDVTIELRYFSSEKAAKKYAKDNGCVNYMID
jgi:hypothetical protein